MEKQRTQMLVAAAVIVGTALVGLIVGYMRGQTTGAREYKARYAREAQRAGGLELQSRELLTQGETDRREIARLKRELSESQRAGRSASSDGDYWRGRYDRNVADQKRTATMVHEEYARYKSEISSYRAAAIEMRAEINRLTAELRAHQPRNVVTPDAGTPDAVRKGPRPTRPRVINSDPTSKGASDSTPAAVLEAEAAHVAAEAAAEAKRIAAEESRKRRELILEQQRLERAASDAAARRSRLAHKKASGYYDRRRSNPAAAAITAGAAAQHKRFTGRN